MNNNFLLRVKDVIICLNSTDKYHVSIGRLELQKMLYLVDSMSAYLFVLSCRKGHQTYLYGPYDKNIQNAIDALVIRDLVKVENVKLTSIGILSCKYLLTNEGKIWSDAVIKNSSSIQQRFEIVDGILYSLVKRNLFGEIRKLVYAEPMYMEVKTHGYHSDLLLDHNNSGHDYLALVEHYIKNKKDSINIRFVTDIYIDYLQERSKMLSYPVLREDN